MSQNRQPDVAVQTFPMPRRRAFAQHVHDRHQLAVAVSGVLSVDVEDRTWVLPPTRALWIPAGVVHTTRTTGSAVLRSAYVDPAGCPIRWTQPTSLVADDLLVALLAHLARPELAGPHRRRAERVLVDAVTPADLVTVSTPAPQDPRAAAVATGLLADPADQRTIEEWGRAVGASGRTLARLFIAETGMTFGQWRTAARIGAALHLLADGMPVARTARRVGYGTPSAFVAAFARELGTTPAAYFAAPHR